MWTRATNSKGYGICTEGLVHRAAYMLVFGPIPEGKYVLHKCDVRNCCNPDHLYVGSQKDNMRDMLERGRTGQRHGQPKGERHSLAKLTESDAKSLLVDAGGGASTMELAAKYKISKTQVNRIISGARWGHLQQ